MQHDLAGVGGQMLEEKPFGAGQLDQLAVAQDHPALEVDLDVIEADDPGARCGARRSAQYRADAGCQFIRMERLGEVVVGAQVQALRLVCRGALCRQQDDRHRPTFA